MSPCLAVLCLLLLAPWAAVAGITARCGLEWPWVPVGMVGLLLALIMTDQAEAFAEEVASEAMNNKPTEL